LHENQLRIFSVERRCGVILTFNKDIRTVYVVVFFFTNSRCVSTVYTSCYRVQFIDKMMKLLVKCSSL